MFEKPKPLHNAINRLIAAILPDCSDECFKRCGDHFARHGGCGVGCDDARVDADGEAALGEGVVGEHVVAHLGPLGEGVCFAWVVSMVS